MPSKESNEVQVYGKPGCVQCKFTVKALDNQHVPYNYVDITMNPVAAEEVKSMGYSSLPVVVAGEQHWSGFSPDKIGRLGK